MDIPAMSATDFLGSYTYKVTQTSRGTIKFAVSNPTSLESGTRIGFPDPNSPYNISLEKYLENPTLYKDAHLVSILSSKTQAQTTGTEGGGDMMEIFTWEEPYEQPWACLKWYPPWPVGLPFLKIVNASR
jgi:hypothetical protein